MLKKIALGAAALLLLLVVVVALQPSDFRVTRSARTAASPADVYPLVEDLRSYDTWNPWGTYDAAMKKTFSGAEHGPGAVYAWESEQVGAGSMTIVGVKPDEQVHIALAFTKPFTAENDVVFDITPQGTGSEVRWSMSGHNGFLQKAMGLFMNMDKMVGADFERGLAELSRLAEARAKAPKPGAEPRAPAEAQAPDASAPASK